MLICARTGLPQWSPKMAIALMDSHEIAIGILSLTAPGIVGWIKMARIRNDSAAAYRTEASSSRFAGTFASFHGSFSTRYRFARATISHTAENLLKKP